MKITPSEAARIVEIEQRWSRAPKGPWREGTGYGGIVCDDRTGYDEPDHVEAYGGHLVCESVPSDIRPVIAGAPSDVAFLLSLVRRGAS